jgi:hypothetical protein
MRLAFCFVKAAVAVACLMIAACGGDRSADSQSSPGSAAVASIKAAVPGTGSADDTAASSGTASPNGTTIPSATQIIDSGGNAWTVAGGVISVNGASAGYSNGVALLLYDNNAIYQENSAGGWWSWNGGTWVPGSDPRDVASPSGASIPAAAQITDSSGNVWAVAGGIVLENGASAGYSNGVALLLYDNNAIYQENSAGGWWSWNGGTWVPGSDPRGIASPNGTTIPSTTQITDSNGNVWTVSGGVVLENGALAGYSNGAALLLYDNNTIYQENSAGGWWSWNGSSWLASSNPAETATGSASLSWTAPTQNTDGTPLTGLAGYTIYYGTSPGALTETIELAIPSATGYVVSSLSSGTYYFAVAAYTTVGTQSAQSSAVSKTIP